MGAEEFAEGLNNSTLSVPLPKRSPFDNFDRSTTGKKLYYNDKRTGPLPPPQLEKQTKLNMTRQRVIYRGENGKPLFKTQ